MEFYLPSIFLLLLAAALTVTLAPNFTPLVLAGFASICLVFAAYNHWSMFWIEYQNMHWASTATAAAPYLVIGSVIVFTVGYIILLFSSGRAPSLSMPPSTIPSPNTSTNFVTRAIGNGLVNTGMVNVGPPTNTAARNILESGLSKKV